MARFTTAYVEFAARLAEVELLRRLAARKERRDPIGLRREINAMCRGAIVLLCAHVEAFIKELGEVVLDAVHTKAVSRARIAPRLYYHISKDILDEIQDTEDPGKIADKVFSFLKQDSAYWSQAGPFPQPIDAERFNKGFASPASRKIRSYFSRFGYSTYDNDLAATLKAQYKPTKNMVDHLVDTRNKIAHGDSTVTKTPTELQDMMRLVRLYCRTTDQVFASWCSTAMCKVR